MKKIITLFSLLLSLSTFADVIEHKNCELFLNSQKSIEFFKAVNLTPDHFASLLKSKGYQAIVYISQPTLDRQAPMSGDQTEDIMSGELKLTVINQKSLKTWLLMSNNKKNNAGMAINTEFIRSTTIVSYKRPFQTPEKFKTETGLDLVNAIPNCQLAQ